MDVSKASYSDRGEGRAVVMIHGFPLDSSLWDEQLALLARGLRLIRFDLPGFGGQPAPEGRGSMGLYAEAVREVLDRAGLERATLCGLSMGGYISFEVLRRFPERVERLVLCDTRAEPDGAEAKAARQLGLRQLASGQRRELLEGYLPKLLSAASYQRAEVVERVRAMNARASDAGIAAALQAMHDRPDSTPLLAGIRAPTLIVVGAEDALTPPSAARAMQQAIPGSRLAEIPGAGHLTPIENPTAFNEALAAFLADQPH